MTIDAYIDDDRRRLLKALAVLTVAPVLNQLVHVTGAAAAPIDPVDELLGLFATHSALCTIGRDYLRRPKTTARVRHFVRELRTLASDRNLMEYLATTVRSDFEDRCIVNLDGWRFAETEVLVCAAAVFVTEASEPVV